MLAIVISVALTFNGHSVKFHHVSKARFGDYRACMDKGDFDVRSMIAHIRRYRHKPVVRVHLECIEQVTFES